MTRSSLALLVVCAACAAGVPPPVAVDTANDTCRYCRMVVSDPRLAAEIVATGEEPLIFDDLGCLRDYVTRHDLPRGALVYVADHRTGEWVTADQAVFTKTATVATPMGSGIVAHRDTVSRDADPAARGGAAVTLVANGDRR